VIATSFLKGSKGPGLELGISAERVRQIEEAAIKRPPVGLVELGEYAWKDTRQFYLECLAYRAEGIGYFYRDRRPPAKCQRELLPYEPPKTLVRIARYLGSPENYQRSQEILRTYEMAGKAPYASPTERAAGQPDWDRAAPPKWKADARIVIEAEQSTMFWASDNLREFEIWSWPGYSRGVPFMVHDRAHQLSQQIAADGTPCTTWAFVGDSHKRRVSKSEVNQPLRLKKPRSKRYVYKPESPLVLLFWARQLIAWHYLRYWKGEDPRERKESIYREVCLEAAE
jgi:hypothetical protein